MYWLLILFAGLFIGGSSPEQRAVEQAGVLQDQTQTLQATQMVRYMNRINDWRYQNPSVDNVSVTDAWSPVTGLSNLISGGRTWVWRTSQPGLMAALLVQTRQSALVGQVTSRRLLDSSGADMQFTVPAAIPNGSVVWVN
ncbi:type IV pilus biogenesis protein PilM [Lelliottia wanjuensis]|uniref:type IV pilus biogenesis protein PilM n=1 Tax=Lelliottia wanjuensis TaxID=3050585 RepID=UPI00254CDA2B|nr:type IV pilus biogenesis protein PilM [Lelliottia sp. V104_15]MDK9605855.1 type IV pilus biogenesis protein PilM [Lelliottia sp. V104_15]